MATSHLTPVPAPLREQVEALTVHGLHHHLFWIRAASALGHDSFRMMWHLLVHLVNIILKTH